LKKRDRTSDEKQFDATLKTAIMRLGNEPQTAEAKFPFPYVLAWDRFGRRGQRVKIIRQTTRTAQIEFEDGFLAVVNRMALRRY
jgi:hypothetical protein